MGNTSHTETLLNVIWVGGLARSVWRAWAYQCVRCCCIHVSSPQLLVARHAAGGSSVVTRKALGATGRAASDPAFLCALRC